MAATLLQPVVALACWTMLVLLYMVVRRFREVRKAGIDLREVRGRRGQDLEGLIDETAVWAAHNYNHLTEQPTVFYAVALALACLGDASPVSLALAWSYVAVRVVHSVYQSFVNVVAVRARLFAASSALLVLLTIRAAFVAI